MSGVLQGVILLVVGSLAVYGCLMAVAAKAGGDAQGHGGHGHH